MATLGIKDISVAQGDGLRIPTDTDVVLGEAADGITPFHSNYAQMRDFFMTGRIETVEKFGAVGDDVTDDTAAIQAALDQGSAILSPNKTYRVTSTLTVPTWATLIGFGRPSSVIRGDNVTGAIVATERNAGAGFQHIANFSVRGVCDTGIECIGAPGMLMENVSVGGQGGGVTTDGFWIELCFSSTFRNLSTLNMIISNYCFNFASDNNACTISGIQTSNADCVTNIRISNDKRWVSSPGVGSQGCHYSGLTGQGGDIGIHLENWWAGIHITGIYTENVALPIKVGPDSQAIAPVGFHIENGFLGGPFSGHRNFATRSASIFVNNVSGGHIGNCSFISYTSAGFNTDMLDGIIMRNGQNVVLGPFYGPGLNFQKKHIAVKRTTETPGSAAWMMHSTSGGNAYRKVEGPVSNHRFVESFYDGNGDQQTELFTPEFATSPPLGGIIPVTAHADSTAYALNDAVYLLEATQHADVTAYGIGDIVYVGGTFTPAVSATYICVTAGTSGTGTPPTGVTNGQSDGSVVWDYNGTEPKPDDNVYRCTVAGTSGTGTPPSGTDLGQIDGGVTWDFHGTLL